MTFPNSSLVTVVQFGGHWRAVKVDAKDLKTFISNPLTTKVEALAKAHCFAKENNLPYKENALIFHKPVVTIWRALDHWIPAKIFDACIQAAGKTTEDKSQAIRMAEQLAVREGLECLICIGESIFGNGSKS